MVLMSLRKRRSTLGYITYKEGKREGWREEGREEGREGG